MSRPIDPGDTLNYQIKGNKFGLIPAETSSQVGGSSGSGNSKKNYHATMFDSRDSANVMEFNVKKSSGAFAASSVSTNGREHQLVNKDTKTYRESELIDPKWTLGKAVEFSSTVANLASCIV